MPEEKNLHYFPDGSSTELSADELAEVRAEAQAIVESGDGSKLVMRSCWLCNPAHLHLVDEESESYLLRCFACGRFFVNGKDLTNYYSTEVSQ